MFITLKKLKDAIRGCVVDVWEHQKELAKQDHERKAAELQANIDLLEKQLKEIRADRDIEDLKLKHLVRMKEEKQSIELEKEKNKLQAAATQKEAQLQQEYHAKVLKTIEESRKEIREVYEKIIKRLPDVNMTISKRG